MWLIAVVVVLLCSAAIEHLVAALGFSDVALAEDTCGLLSNVGNGFT